MDLGAYALIEDLREIAEANGIDVPRLRGYRLMKYENRVPEEKIEKWLKECEVETAEWLCETNPPFCPKSCERWLINDTTDRRKARYLKSDPKNKYQYLGIRWNRIHGKKRKILKHEIKKQKQMIRKQYDTFNKYAGREDVLYIHSRVGSSYTWEDYEDKRKLMSQPWLLEKVDDSYDGTYCDFYAKIDPKTVEEFENSYKSSKEVE